MAFQTSIDVGNRALQHVGARRIATFADNSKQAAEIGFCYDKLRVAELRRSVWRFATRRAYLRPYTATTQRIIPALYNNVTAYAAGQIVMDSTGVYWICMATSTGNAPGGTPPVGFPPFWQQYFGPVVADIWGAGTYNAGDLSLISSNVYLNTLNNNTSSPPGNGWVTQPVAVFQPLFNPQPVGPGLSVVGRLRNAFPLPNGYLRVTSPDPKVESTSTLSTSAALRFSDWQFEGNYIISNSTTPILLRFIADVSDVTAMDSLFCEALAARIGYEICEPLTQSNVKLQAIAAAYQKFVKDARLVNWLETGSTEPQEEEYELTKGPAGVRDPATTNPGSSPSEG